ncbi:hypothetical protein BH23CHL4_BH23CHL4_16050 [soil metagenome]
MTGSLPNVGRPKGSTWRQLQDEGIVWEGQVLITGDDIDLAAMLIVTNMRLAFVRGGTLALDIDRDWLDPAPVLRRTGTVQLWVSPPNDPISESLTFLARDGRDEAAVLLSLIGDHGAYGSAYRLPTYVPDAAPEPLPFPAARSRRRRHAYDDHGFNAPPALPVFSILDDDDFPAIMHPSSLDQDIVGSLEPGGPIPLAASIRNPNDPIKPIHGFESREERDRRSWVIRIAGLFLTVGLISAIAGGLMPGLDDVRDLIDSPTPTPGPVAQIDVPARTPEPSPTPTTTIAPTVTVAGPSSSEPQDPTVVPLETAVALGVGSDQPSQTPTTTPEPTAEPEPTPTTTEGVVQVAQATEEPTAQAPVIPPPEPTGAPTETSIAEPTATDEATTEPDPTGTGAEEVLEPEAETSGALQDQEATLESDEVLAQTFEMNGLRLQISAGFRASSLPELTLGRSAAGEWVVLLLDAVNWSDEPANLAMPDFRLALASDLASEIPLDVSTGAVATYLDLTPVLRPTESVVVPPGGYQPIALVFGVPAGSDNLALLAGDQVIALDLSFENQSSGALQGPEFAAPELVAGTVVDVLDGQTVSVDFGGEPITVQYYGLQAMEADACYAGESTAAHSSLVSGQTLFFERERRNRSETTVYLRDAWITDESGNLQLAAAALTGQGAAVPEPSEPDIRFAGWLAGQALSAEMADAGIWSVCG